MENEDKSGGRNMPTMQLAAYSLLMANVKKCMERARPYFSVTTATWSSALT